MSGGHFNYAQHHIYEIIHELETVIENNGKTISMSKFKIDVNNPEGFPADECINIEHYEYPSEIINRFKDALLALKISYIYAQRIDWLLSGDDGDESFIKRLDEELKLCI